jgi:hypothetical protein
MMPLAEALSQLGVLAAAAFLLLQGAWALCRPQAVRSFLDGFASSAAAHFVELGVRIVVGVAFLGAAPRAALPDAFTAFGWLLLGTSLPLLLVPWRWHRRFARWAVPLATRWMPPYALGCLVAGVLILGGLLGGGAMG